MNSPQSVAWALLALSLPCAAFRTPVATGRAVTPPSARHAGSVLETIGTRVGVVRSASSLQGSYGGDIFETARRAKEDDPVAQRQLWCQSIGRGYPLVGAGTVIGIGGWYSIRVLLALTDGVADDNYRHSKEYNSAKDAAAPLPSWFALSLLTDTLPEAGIPEPREVSPEQIVQLQQRWHEWITQHESELRQRPPIGAKVVLTPDACR